MRFSLRFLLFVATNLAITHPLFGQWVQTNGPYGGRIVASMLNDTNLFVASIDAGIYRSTNNGASWSAANTGLTNRDVRDFAVVGVNLFAGTGGGVFRSTNNGASWTAVNSGLTSSNVSCLAVIGTNIFVGTNGGGVFRSTNNGASWTAVNNGLTNTLVQCLAVSGTNLFAGTNSGGGVYLSTNNGTSWVYISDGLYYPTQTNIISLVAFNETVLAGTPGGIFRSTNNGTSWREANTGLTPTFIYALAADSTSVFAGMWGGVYRSTNNGASWTAVNNGLGDIYVNSLALSDGILIAGTEGGVFLSTNDGGSWTAINNGLTAVCSRSFAIKENNIFAATSGNGVFLSTNNGMSWISVNAGLTGRLLVRSLATNGMYLLSSTDRGVFRSTNNGASWTSLTTLTFPYTSSLAISGSNLFAGTFGTPGEGIYRSTNNGASWSAANTGLTNRDVRDFAVVGVNLFAGTGGGVFRSTNNGASWTAVNSGLTSSNVSCLAVIGTNIFVGTNGGGVFRSTNNGASWTAVNNGLTNTEITCLRADGLNLFAGTSDGAFAYIGNSWQAINLGLTSLSIMSLATNETDLFAGTDGGVWRRPLREVISSTYVVEEQFNRIPARVSQDWQSTLPLRFSNYSDLDGDRGPLNVVLRVKNVTNTDKYYREVVAKYLNPNGAIVEPNSSLFSSNYFYKLGPGDEHLFQAYIDPPKTNEWTNFAEPGMWRVNIQLQERENLLSRSTTVESFWLPFEVVARGSQLANPPPFDQDKLGQLITPLSAFNQQQSSLYYVLKDIQAILKLVGGDNNPMRDSYIDYYEGMKSTQQQLAQLYGLRLESKRSSGGSRRFNVVVFKSGAMNFSYDRAVVSLALPLGFTRTNILDDGGSHLVENMDGRLTLTWIINAVDKRINWKFNWRTLDLHFELEDNAIQNYEIDASIMLMLGPYQGENNTFSSLADAPWIYNYERWNANPDSMFWYPVTFGATKTRISNPVPAARVNANASIAYPEFVGSVQSVLPFYLANGLSLNDGTELFIPSFTFNKDLEITWVQDNPVLAYPPKFAPTSNQYSLGISTLDSVFDNPVALIAKADSQSSANQAIFRWNPVDSIWENLPSMVDSAGRRTTTQVDRNGIYRAFQPLDGGLVFPEVELLSPIGMRTTNHRPYFTWRDSTGMKWNYQLEIDTTMDFIEPILVASSSEPAFRPSNPLGEGRYFWRARRGNASGFPGLWSGLAAFDVITDSLPPSIVRLYPDSGESVTRDSVIRILLKDDETGVSESSILLTVDSSDVGFMLDPITHEISSDAITALSDGQHQYTVSAADLSGNIRSKTIPFSIIISTVGEIQILPLVFELSQSYPNPFNATAVLRYGLPTKSKVKLTIFNILGQRIVTLLDNEVNAGYHQAIWNANTASGVYFYRLEAVAVDDPTKRFVDVKKMILVK